MPLLLLSLLGRKQLRPTGRVIHQLGEQHCPRRGQRPPSPPQVQRRWMAVPNRLLPRGRNVDGVQRKRDLDQLLAYERRSHHLASCAREAPMTVGVEFIYSDIAVLTSHHCCVYRVVDGLAVPARRTRPRPPTSGITALTLGQLASPSRSDAPARAAAHGRFRSQCTIKCPIRRRFYRKHRPESQTGTARRRCRVIQRTDPTGPVASAPTVWSPQEELMHSIPQPSGRSAIFGIPEREG